MDRDISVISIRISRKILILLLLYTHSLGLMKNNAVSTNYNDLRKWVGHWPRPTPIYAIQQDMMVKFKTWITLASSSSKKFIVKV